MSTEHLHVQLICFVQSALQTENLNDGWVTQATSLQMYLAVYIVCLNT